MRLLLTQSRAVFLIIVLSACSRAIPGQEAFSVPAQDFIVEGERVFLFEYDDAALIEKDIAALSPDGRTLGEQKLFWDGPVHVYATGNQLAVYVGSNAIVLKALQSEGGGQIAGDK
ncbi:MAG: hypothetical protein Q7R81_06985 [Candidatus Peregrinibacteria bacterium]|nr:hypothetical protein [Candidatus Peregrinibacteria bacterium]